MTLVECESRVLAGGILVLSKLVMRRWWSVTFRSEKVECDKTLVKIPSNLLYTG